MVEERSNKRNGMVACEREGDGTGSSKRLRHTFSTEGTACCCHVLAESFSAYYNDTKIRYHDTTM